MMADSSKPVDAQVGGNQADTSVVLAVRILADFARGMGVKLEFIKFSGPTGFKSIYGVDFRTDIYEDEATLWRHAEVTGLVPTFDTPSTATSNKPPNPTPREDV